MAAHKSTPAKIQPLIHNLPELLQIFSGRTGHIHQIQRHHSLIKPSVELRLIIFVMIDRQKRPASHTGIAVAVFQFLHDLLRNIIRHHPFRGTLCRQLCQVPVFCIFPDIVLLQHINQLRKSRRNINALFIFNPLDPLHQHLLYDQRQIVPQPAGRHLINIHKYRNKRRLSIGGHQGDNLILYDLYASFDLIFYPAFCNLIDLFFRDRNSCFLHLSSDFPAEFPAAHLHKRRQMRKRDTLSAVLGTCNLCNNLRCNIARRRKTMRFFDHRTADHRSVLQHIFQIDQTAVMHMLRKIIRIMEMDNSVFMRFHDILRQ